MTERATPNLPAIDPVATEAFYHALGFSTQFRDRGWMILARCGIVLEFFPYPDLDPYQSSFGACIRGLDVDAIFALWKSVIGSSSGIPRIEPPRNEGHELRISYMVDPNGTLIRIVGSQELPS